MNYKFGVYGDSIAFSYGNNNQSWFDELYLGNEALKLAQNGEQIEDVLNKIKQDDNHYDTLFLAVGINDLLSGAPKLNQIDISSLINQYEEVLKVAKTKASNIIVQSVLPVREELFPNQAWLDEDKWGFNADVKTFNQKLAKLCETHQIKYLDAYTNFSSLDLSKIYIDAVHLNKEGQQELAMVYRKHSSKIKYVIFDVGGVCYPYTLDNLNQYFRNKVADKNAFDSKKGIKSFDYNPFMQGTINYTQFCKDLCNYCGVNHSPDMEAEINTAMHEGVGTIFEETLTIMNKLKKKNIEICLLSNALPNLIDTANFLTKSENIFVSYELGLLKPNPEIYKKVLQKLNATPEEVIFIDDKSRNVEAAKSLGIHGIVFDQKTIIEDINKLVSIS